jgi:Fic family protein
VKYIWQHENWPKLGWKSEPLLSLISKARLAQGKLLTKVESLGFKLSREAKADILTEEAVKTSAIEGERLNRESVRSSVARHLGLPAAGLAPANRSIDGLVEVLWMPPKITKHLSLRQGSNAGRRRFSQPDILV